WTHQRPVLRSLLALEIDGGGARTALPQSCLRCHDRRHERRFRRQVADVADVGWAKAQRAVPTIFPQMTLLVGTLRFAHPTISAAYAITRSGSNSAICTALSDASLLFQARRRRVGKGATRRAHHLSTNDVVGGHASLCPPCTSAAYAITRSGSNSATCTALSDASLLCQARRRRVGKGATRRAHHLPQVTLLVGTLRFAHPATSAAYAITRSGSNSAICTALSAAPLRS